MEEQNNIDTETQADGSGGGSAPTPTNGSAATSKKVPSDVRHRVQQSLNDFEQQKRVNQANIDDMNPFGRSVHQFEGDFIDVESQGTQNTSSGSIGTSSAAKKRTVGSARGILSYFPSGTSPGSQPSIKAALQSKERWGQEENEDTSSFLLRMAKQGLGLAVGGFKQKVQKLITNFEDIQAVLEDAEKKQVKEASVRRWLKKLKDVAYDVEDLLEEWETAKLKSQLESKQWVAENGPLLKKVRHSISSSSTQIFQQLHISKKIDDFNERLDVIAIEKDRYKFEVDQKGVDDQLERLTVSLVDEKEIYGRDEEKTTLVKLLLGENTSLEDVQSKSNLHVISIVGMGGMGKTTLAQLVFNHHQVQRHFEERIWNCQNQ
ncbi:NB-ARC domain-containing protein [Corchorus olitorius]|uniref:NB-ARC domain-containing protein n=1 Tax=Corchorus olitorius TaxID=93759 RepID=A0A1R3HV04_9ROSI|nr:NB-ARC domain-containing protein [Corchorus olitorius]